MKVLFITKGQDNANMGYMMMKAASMAGCEVRGYVTKAHPFGYPDSLPVGTALDIERGVEWADIIHYYKSVSPCAIVDKPSVIQHGDDNLRDYGKEIQESYAHVSKRVHICETADLIKYLNHGEEWYYIGHPTDTDLLRPTKREGKIKVGHFPSIVSNKGSEIFSEVLHTLNKELDFEPRYDTQNVSWQENVHRIGQMDIYLDNLSIDRGGNDINQKPLGESGVTCKEAAALGVVPISNAFNLAVYNKVYGEHGYLTANSRDEIYTLLYGLISMGRPGVEALGMKARRWVEQKHSLQAISKQLMPVYIMLLGL